MIQWAYAVTGNRKLSAALLLTSSLTGLLATGPAAYAQTSSAETVVVTGSLIRGVSHTGSDLISLGPDEMRHLGATSVQQMLNSLPALTTFGTDGMQFGGGVRDSAASGVSTPVIHGIGQSPSIGTLTLIDGHRIATAGINQVQTDPGIVPDIAIQRVEVLPDGSSSLYGADAVAGVVNFITRKDFEGLQTRVTAGSADHFQRFNFGQLAGFQWDRGGAVLAYQYSSRSNLLLGARSQFTALNQSAIGGTNLNNFNCSPASISQTNASSGTASNVFSYPYTGATIGSAGSPSAAPCDSSRFDTLSPSETHHAIMVSVRDQLTDKIGVNFVLDLSSRVNNARAGRGTLSATAFGPTGSGAALGVGQRNPFYVGNTTTGTASEFVRYDFNDLLGPGAHEKSAVRDVFADLSVDVDLGGGWAATVAGTTGYDISADRSSGTVSAAEALLALNGTTNAAGSAVTSPLNSALADYYGLGSVVAVTRTLTTLNALDVWTPAATNRTSAQVLKSLMNGNNTNQGAEHAMNELRLKFDGPLFSLPAGEVRTAVGAQYDGTIVQQIQTRNNNTGPSNNSARLDVFRLHRSVYAAFAEVFAPLVSPEMNVPLVQKLDLDISGRFDHYSDFGDTKNPKVGLNWIVTDGLAVRASYGTSFAAPKLNNLGEPVTGLNSVSSAQSSSSAFTIPASHPNYPGSFCTVIVGPCNVTSAQQGIAINGGNADLQPQTGLTYSAGVDINAGSLMPALNGLKTSVTYWQVKYINQIGRPLLADVTNTPGLQHYLLLAPPGGWNINDPAVQAFTSVLPVTGNLPTTVFYIYNGVSANAFNSQVNGIDFDVSYGFDTSSYGSFLGRISGSDKLRNDGQGGGKGSTAPYINFNQGINNNSSQRAVALSFRSSLRWDMDPFSATLFWNFINPYWNPITTPPYNTATLLPNGVTGGGYQKVAANHTFDLDLSYSVPKGWPLETLQKTSVSLHVTNILNSRPPYYAGNNSGFDSFNASPLGRSISFTINEEF